MRTKTVLTLLVIFSVVLIGSLIPFSGATSGIKNIFGLAEERMIEVRESKSPTLDAQTEKAVKEKSRIIENGGIEYVDPTINPSSINEEYDLPQEETESVWNWWINLNATVVQTNEEDMNDLQQNDSNLSIMKEKDKHLFEKTNHSLSAQKFGRKADMNNDRLVNFADIDWFRMIHDYQWFFKENHPDLFWRADIDDNGIIDENDTELFLVKIR